MPLAIVRLSEAPGAAEAIPERDEHPYWGEFGRRYYPAASDTDRRDESFVVTDGGTPALCVPCTGGDRVLDWFGLPIRFFARRDMAPADGAAATRQALLHLDALAVERDYATIVIRDRANSDILSPLGEACLRRGGTASVGISGLCDVGRGEAGMRQGLRRSFRSLLNWGRRNLETRFVGAADRDRALFARYQEFHARVSGRVTRPQPSWEVMFDWLAAGRGELVLGFLEGVLVSGTMVVDGRGISAYASGVYDRAHFDKPLAHWPLWLAMLRSAGRGNRLFDLGELPLPGAGNEKEQSIAYFKRGFATTMAVWLRWTLSPGQAREADEP